MKNLIFINGRVPISKKLKGNGILLLIFLAPFLLQAQSNLVAEISGNPADISNWTATSVEIEGEEVVLTNATGNQNGAIFFSQPYNLNQCEKWRVEFDFRMFDSADDEPADGLAFWYLENPPTELEFGGSLGMPADGNGLKVAFDTYNNDSPQGNPNPEIQVYYGEGYDESFPEPDMLKEYVPGLRSNNYQHAEISWDAGDIEIVIDGAVVLTGTPQPFDQAENIVQGYFGFSASTGWFVDRHSIKNVQVFIDAIQLENDFVQIEICDQDENGFEQFDLTSMEDVFSETGNFSYYTSEVDAAFEENSIPNESLGSYTNSEAFTDEIIYVRVENDAGCYVIGELELVLSAPPNINSLVVDIPGACDSGQDGIENFDLTQTESIFVNNPVDVEFLYFENQTAAENGDPSAAIPMPTSYSVAAGATETVYVRIGGACYQIGVITLATYVTPQINATTQLVSCDNSSGSFVFDLTENDDDILGNQNPSNVNFTYHTSQADADGDENEIVNLSSYQISSLGCETIYVRMENSAHPECYSTSSFQICAVETSIGNPLDLQECATAENGMAIFNLTENNGNVLDGQDATIFNIHYFASLADAESGANIIPGPSAYQAITQMQTIFVRIESIYNSNCYEVESFEIETIEIEVLEIDGITECLEGNTGMDLTEVEVNFDATQEVVDYFSSEEDAYSGENPIVNPETFSNELGIEEIFVRVENQQQPCFQIFKFPILGGACDLLIPEGFSPNGDGVNDVFEVSGLYENYPNFSLEIFSRHGRMIYKGNSSKDYWNGASEEGNDLPTGTYYYVLKLNNSESNIFNGWVYLNR